MSSMKAVRMHAYGGRDVLKYEDAPMPVVEDGEVLIRVHAAAVNPFDWKVRSGYLVGWLNHTLPLTLGWDVSGVIEAVASNVENLRVGNEVYAHTDVGRNGAYAEYVVVQASSVARKPQSLDHTRAAAVPQSGLTAWQSLFSAAGLAPSQTVLIHAAAGGVGSFAVQLAKWRGARVIGTSSARNHDFLRQLGADDVIDYTATRFEDMVHDVDVVLDAVGGETQERSWKVLKPGGILVSIVQPMTDEAAKAHGVRQQFVSAHPDVEHLDQLSGLINAGHIMPMVSTVFSLQEVSQAHALSESGHARGKIVLRVADQQ